MLALALLLALLIAALSAAQPLLTRVVIDQGLIGHQFPRLVGACLGMLALALTGFVLLTVWRAPPLVPGVPGAPLMAISARP